MADNIEKRFNNCEIRIDSDSRLVEGYAVVFESESEDMGFREVIHSGAITDDVIASSDVLARFDHNQDKVLARSKRGKGSLHLELDERGLKYTFSAPKTALGDELLEYIERGDITGASFAFSLDSKDESAEKWTNRDGVIWRDIYHINRLYDIAPCFTPAYEATSCESKRYAEIKATCDEVNAALQALENEINTL